MFVTGVQAVGAKGLGSVQVGAVDANAAVRAGAADDNDRERDDANGSVRPGEPQRVVFPREGVPLDQRPVALKQEQALRRYAVYGGADADYEISFASAKRARTNGSKCSSGGVS
jgi:hypothetical protein